MNTIHRAFTRVFFAAALLASCSSGGGGGGGGGGKNNTTPVANAGRGLNTVTNALVILDGSASTDADGDTLSYRWTMISRPAGSTATLSDSSSIAPTFTTDLSGTYTIGLVVNDGITDSTQDTVDILALSSVSHLHDTGVTNCFNVSSETPCPDRGQPFYGQDAHYSTNPMRFADDGTTVTDALTGLTWPKTDPASLYNWYQAAGVYDATYNATSIDVCGSSTLGGHTDWRLPSRRELVSIVNYAQGAPEQAYFQGSGTYWSSTRIGFASASNVWVITGSRVWGALGFQDGLAAPYNVKCVRGTPWGQNNFTDNGDGTVTDSMSGLRWQKNDDGVARNWQDALSYCEGLTLGGSSDWRLPDIKELESLVYILASGYSLPMDTTYFTPRTDAGGLSFYWSSTTSLGVGLGVDFWDGNVGDGGVSKANFKFTRCVR